MSAGNIHFLGIGRVEPDPRWYIAAQSHLFSELIVPISGRMSVIMNGRQYDAAPGDVLYYPAGTAHEERSDSREPVATIFTSFDWDCGQLNLPLMAQDIQGRIREMMSWLLVDRDLAATVAGQAQQNAMLAAVLSRYQYCATYNRAENELVRNIRQLVRRRLDEALDLEDLANAAGLSRFHFTRRYAELTGRTPMADVRAIRLERARELLLTTSMPLKQIARQIGMGSEYALSRAYRKHFGIPPSHIRRVNVSVAS